MIRFEEGVVDDASLDDLDGTLIERFRTVRTHAPADTRETFLAKLGMAGDAHGGPLRPTVAGILMGTRQPERWLSHASIQAAAYRGDAIPEVDDVYGFRLDARELIGSLDHLVARACRFVIRNMRVGATKRIGRIDVPQYDITAVFEAVVNAVAHAAALGGWAAGVGGSRHYSPRFDMWPPLSPFRAHAQ